MDADAISLARDTITITSGAPIWSEESTGEGESGVERKEKKKREARRGRIVLVTTGVRNIIIPGDSCVALA